MLFCTITLMNEDDAPAGQWQFKPGDTITPGTQPAGESATKPAATDAQPPTPTVQTPAPEQPENSPNVSKALPATPAGAISWTASEFIAHNKSIGWYLSLGAGALILAALIFLLTKDKITTSVVLVGAIVLGAYGARQPRQLQYGLTTSGLSIGDRYHPYEDFRSFAVLDEGAFASIVFLPLKRFAPLTTIYYDPEDENKIIALLADRLPLEERQHDAVDRFLRRIRY